MSIDFMYFGLLLILLLIHIDLKNTIIRHGHDFGKK